MIKWKTILILVLAFVAAKITAANSQATALVSRAIYDVGKYIITTEDPEFKARLRTTANKVVLDTYSSHQMGWYAEQEAYDHRTTKNSWKSEPQSTNHGVPTTDHRIYPAKFDYYDMRVYIRDPQTMQFIRQDKWIEKGWLTPEIYINGDLTYVIYATTKKSEAKWRVFSEYSMEDGPDDRLRKPGTYPVDVRYKVYKLSYTKEKGMVKIPDDTERTIRKELNIVADDEVQVDLLDRHQWMMEGPNVYNYVTRDWKHEEDVLVYKKQFLFPPTFPSDPDLIHIEEVWSVQEKITKVEQ